MRMRREPRTVAFAGDWHANRVWAVKAIRGAAGAGAEAIVHLGDFGYEFRPAYLQAVEVELAAAGIELWFVDGNHESFPVLERFPVLADGRRQLTGHVFHLPRGFRWQWAGLQFLAVGGAYSIDRPWRTLGESWWAGETITDEDVAAAVAGGPADVLVSHDCPAGVLIPGLEATAHLWQPEHLEAAQAHRHQLSRVVAATRPRRIFHGHYHRHYETTADFGYGPVVVDGLDCDETTLSGNVTVRDLSYLQPAYAAEVAG